MPSPTHDCILLAELIADTVDTPQQVDKLFDILTDSKALIWWLQLFSAEKKIQNKIKELVFAKVETKMLDQMYNEMNQTIEETFERNAERKNEHTLESIIDDSIPGYKDLMKGGDIH